MKDQETFERILTSLCEGEEGMDTFHFTKEPGISTYLGVGFKADSKNGSVELMQPYLIERILTLFDVKDKFNCQSTPATKPLLIKDENGKDRKCSWNYCQAIGMLNYLQTTTRPDLAFAVHQTVRFSIDPKLIHERAVQRIF